MPCQDQCWSAADLGVAGHAPEAVDAGVGHPVQVVCHRAAGHFALHVIISRLGLVQFITSSLPIAVMLTSTLIEQGISRHSLRTAKIAEDTVGLVSFCCADYTSLYDSSEQSCDVCRKHTGDGCLLAPFGVIPELSMRDSGFTMASSSSIRRRQLSILRAGSDVVRDALRCEGLAARFAVGRPSLAAARWS